MNQSATLEQSSSTLRVFLIMWIGQFISGAGSGFSRFALGIWVYQQTGAATDLAIISFLGLFPLLVATPFAGVLVDRWNPRVSLIISDVGSSISTIGFLVLVLNGGSPAIWQIGLLVTISALFGSLQAPASAVATTLLVPKEQLGRINGLVQLGEGFGQLIFPLLTGVLMGLIGFTGIVIFDLVSFVIATVILLFVRFPAIPTQQAAQRPRRNIFREAKEGWAYIRDKAGLVQLMVFFFISNYLLETIIVLATPLMLSFSTPAVLGTVLSVAGLGMMLASLAISVWGVPKPPIYGVFGGILLSGVCMMLAGLAPSAWLIGITAFFFAAGIPLSITSSQTIWQRKVPLEMQGRIFAIRSVITTAALPLARLVSGPLVDYGFNPLLMPDGVLAQSVGRVIGVGPGRGIGLLFIVLGGLVVLLVLASYANPHLRQIDQELPDAVASRLPEPAV
ncbi:MAG: MFS transporter [Roseiflexaceae bacterium]